MWWRLRESNPPETVSEGETESDTSRTLSEQKRHNSHESRELRPEPNPVTEPAHFPNTSDTSECVSSVSPRDALPPDLPRAVVDGLRNWHRLPENIRQAVEALLRRSP